MSYTITYRLSPDHEFETTPPIRHGFIAEHYFVEIQRNPHMQIGGEAHLMEGDLRVDAWYLDSPEDRKAWIR